jgi:hypothetical protein
VSWMEFGSQVTQKPHQDLNLLQRLFFSRPQSALN